MQNASARQRPAQAIIQGNDLVGVNYLVLMTKHRVFAQLSEARHSTADFDLDW